MVQRKYNKLKKDATNFATRLQEFNVDFFDQVKFKRFVDTEVVELFSCYDEICISGHFSEGFAELVCQKLNGVRTNLTLRLLTSSTGIASIEALRRIQDAGAEIRYNRNLYFRMFVGKSSVGGILVLGTFDFNRDGMGMNRRDAGIHTSHPDLVQSAYEYFIKVWNEERGSIPLDEKFPDESTITKEKNPSEITPSKEVDSEPEQSSGITTAVKVKEQPVIQVSHTEPILVKSSVRPRPVVANTDSMIYHRPTCEYLPSDKNREDFKSRAFAQAEGYNPCKVCEPQVDFR